MPIIMRLVSATCLLIYLCTSSLVSASTSDSPSDTAESDKFSDEHICWTEDCFDYSASTTVYASPEGVFDELSHPERRAECRRLKVTESRDHRTKIVSFGSMTQHAQFAGESAVAAQQKYIFDTQRLMLSIERLPRSSQDNTQEHEFISLTAHGASQTTIAYRRYECFDTGRYEPIWSSRMEGESRLAGARDALRRILLELHTFQRGDRPDVIFEVTPMLDHSVARPAPRLSPPDAECWP